MSTCLRSQVVYGILTKLQPISHIKFGCFVVANPNSVFRVEVSLQGSDQV